MNCGLFNFEVYCDMKGKWAVIQRRFNGGVTFHHTWSGYDGGFGQPRGDYWIGLRNIHSITNVYPGVKFRVELEDWEGNVWYAEYSQFQVGDLNSNYRLNVSGYSGTAGDQLSHHSGQMFSTHDRDNDNDSRNCAQTYRGGWWFTNCGKVNLNGQYLTGGVSKASGITWDDAKPDADKHYSFKYVEMKIKIKERSCKEM